MLKDFQRLLMIFFGLNDFRPRYEMRLGWVEVDAKNPRSESANKAFSVSRKIGADRERQGINVEYKLLRQVGLPRDIRISTT